MSLSTNSKKCLCIKEYKSAINGVLFTHKVDRMYYYMDYSYAPHVIGIYGKNNNHIVGIDIEDFKNHFQEIN